MIYAYVDLYVVIVHIKRRSFYILVFISLRVTRVRRTAGDFPGFDEEASTSIRLDCHIVILVPDPVYFKQVKEQLNPCGAFSVPVNRATHNVIT